MARRSWQYYTGSYCELTVNEKQIVWEEAISLIEKGFENGRGYELNSIRRSSLRLFCIFAINLTQLIWVQKTPVFDVKNNKTQNLFRTKRIIPAPSTAIAVLNVNKLESFP